MEKRGDSLFFDILRRAPSRETILLVLQKMKEEGRTDEVIRECREALNLYPDDIRLRRLLVETCQEAGLVDDAASEIEEITSMMDDLSMVYRSQAELLMQRHMESEARDMLKRYLAHHPEDQDAAGLFNRLGAVEGDTGKEAPSLELATPTIAELYYDQGKIGEAARIYEKIISENPEDTVSKNRLQELKALMSREKEKESSEGDRLAEKKRKENMVMILEGWLTRLQELRHA